MSDRSACNLRKFKSLQRQHGPDRLNLTIEEGWTSVYLDDRLLCSYWVLPTESECGFYGGTCDC